MLSLRGFLSLSALLLAWLLVATSASQSAHFPPPPEATAADLKEERYWPDDPLYGYAISAQSGERVSGQWPLYSFIPDRSPDAPFVRPSEVSAGMSVDLAWRYGLGNPRVVIAVLGTGIDWSNLDLLTQLALNLGELRPPTLANGDPCPAPNPDKPDAPPVDCNEDGIFDVSDYEFVSFLNSTPAEGAITDTNSNEVLDGADLIAHYSNGIDDDGNGFIDDIAGWDFADDDNDPADSWNQIQGTLHASLAVAQANNGHERAGACPGCRFVPLRTGPLNIATPDHLALAINYAVDRGAQVILATTEVIGHSRLLQASIDNAYERGSLIITSMGDHSSRRHTALSTANHVLTVGGMGLLGTDQQSTTATSFLAFNTCSGFGGQLMLSASSAGCAREGAATTGGIVGLLLSRSFEVGYDLQAPGGKAYLTPAEARQILINGTDDVAIEDSHEASSPHFFSQPGFDQRFGYGRISADRAVQTVSGDPPPRVDLRSPRWFESFVVEQVPAPIKILGTVSARRAATYRYTVEWAPGVEPSEEQFTVIRAVQEIPGTIVTGKDSEPLAEIDVRGLNLEDAPDPNTAFGENTTAVTLRVRARAHYANGTVTSGEARRTIHVHSETELLPGFPRHLGATSFAGPKLADIDGDGVRDIVVATMNGEVHALTAVGGKLSEISGFPAATQVISELSSAEHNPETHRSAASYRDLTGTGAAVATSLAREPIYGAPAVGDLNGDGNPEIVAVSVRGKLYAFSPDGSSLDGFPLALPALGVCGAPELDREDLCLEKKQLSLSGVLASPVLTDIDVDEELEIVVASLDGQVHAYERDGQRLSGYPLLPDSQKARPITSPPVTADFDGDRIVDLLVASHDRLGKSSGGAVFTLLYASGQKRGLAFSGWPIVTQGRRFDPLLSEGAAAAPVAADLDHDGKREAILHGNTAKVFALPVDPGLQEAPGELPANALPKANDDNSERPGLDHNHRGAGARSASFSNFLAWAAQPAVADLNQDGVLDIIAGGGESQIVSDFRKIKAKSTPSKHLIMLFDGATGRSLPGSPLEIEDSVGGNGFAVADLDADGYPEVIFGSAGYRLHAVDACGEQAPGFPKFLGQWLSGTPAVADINGDGRLDVVVTTRNGWLFAYSTRGSTDGVIFWESAHHDNHNTSALETRLEQGSYSNGGKPLALDPEGRCLAPAPSDPKPAVSYRPRGGCQYRARGADRLAWFSCAAAWSALLLARRRRLRLHLSSRLHLKRAFCRAP